MRVHALMKRYTVENIHEIFVDVTARPVRARIPRNLFLSIKPYLVKRRILYKIIDIIESNDEVEVLLMYPDHIILPDENIVVKSSKLLEDALQTLMKHGKVIEVRNVGFWDEVLSLLKDVCAKGIRLLHFLCEVGVAHILCNSSRLIAACFDGPYTLLGIAAFRTVFYSLPCHIVVYDVHMG